MSVTKQDIQLAIRVSRAAQQYLDNTKEVDVRSTEIFSFMVRRGLFEMDKHNGLYFRRFLKKLYNDNMLNSLVPQCKYLPGMGNQHNGEWYFNSAKEKMAKVIRFQFTNEVQQLPEPMTFELAEEMVQMLLAGINPISEQKLPENDICMHPRVQEALEFIITPILLKPDTAPVPEETPIFNNDYSQKEIEKRVCSLKTEVDSWGIVRKEDTLQDYQRYTRIKHPRAFEKWRNREKEILIELLELLNDSLEVSRLLKRTHSSIELMMDNLAQEKI